MEIAPDAVEAPSPAAERRFRGSDNPVVRAVGRIPLPLGAKLIAGFVLIAVLLVVGYALGVAALGQSNSRGLQLRALQRQAAYEQLLLSDATHLQSAVATLSFEPDSTFVQRLVAGETTQLKLDAVGQGNGLHLATPDSNLERATFARLQVVEHLADFALVAVVPSAAIQKAEVAVSTVEADFAKAERRTRAQANALVAANHGSFHSSRNLLIGVGAGSFALALALGLLLSSSVVAPLRRTRTRLAAVAAGDFSSQVEVPNRDEIGGLAGDVNRMSGELQRLYRELELASEHKSQFLANMSHELRTPLNAIIGFSEVLHEQMFGELNERQLTYVDDVIEAGKHLLSLINDVLDLAKIEAGRMELELSDVTIPDVLRSAVSMHSERASRDGIALALTTEPERIVVTADERRVRQVVFNLVSNAVKFTPAEGRVDISARLADGTVEVAVTDTGPGIAPADLDTIFEEFEQTTAGKQAEGTGLGLPLSRKLVELHGGRLWGESETGKGSTFRFTLPVQQEVS